MSYPYSLLCTLYSHIFCGSIFTYDKGHHFRFSQCSSVYPMEYYSDNAPFRLQLRWSSYADGMKRTHCVNYL